MTRKVARLGEYFAKHGLEKIKWERVVLRVKRFLIVLIAKLDTRVVVLVVFETVACIAVFANEVAVVVKLEEPVMLNDPVKLGTNEWPED